jgi:hypothetical protein
MQGKAHPSWEELAAYAEGGLDAAERAALARHLEDCAECDLEVKRMTRFATIDTDEELLAEADWAAARPRLDAAWRDGIGPALREAADPIPSLTKRLETRRLRLAWIVPVAAAAALILFAILRPGGGLDPLQDPRLGDPLRGAAADTSLIAPLAPSGELEALPEQFTWSSAEDFDGYALELFTAELEILMRVEKIAASSFGAPDSLRRLLHEDRIYLWTVEAYRGLDRVAVSETAWFRVLAAAPDSAPGR